MLDALLLSAAIVLQSADTAYTCRGLARGGVEVNPVYGAHPSCARVALTKAAFFAPVVALPKTARRVWLGSLAAGGAIGVTFTLKLGPKD